MNGKILLDDEEKQLAGLRFASLLHDRARSHARARKLPKALLSLHCRSPSLALVCKVCSLDKVIPISLLLEITYGAVLPDKPACFIAREQ